MSAEAAVKYVTETTEEEKERVAEWINTEEYKNLNFKREALVFRPPHACQPLGAELVAHAFEGSLPFVHGSQGCASYYRSTLNRHFREPAPAVSDSMTEDGAVFGGQNNLHEGLENAIAIYKPKMVSIFTSCMPEIIGDDLVAFLKNARNKGIIPEGYAGAVCQYPQLQRLPHPRLRCHAECHPAYPDRREKGGRALHRQDQPDPRVSTPTPATSANTSGFFAEFGVPLTILGDISDVFDAPCDGTYHTYPGGTKLDDAGDSINGKATLSLGPYSAAKTFAWVKEPILLGSILPSRCRSGLPRPTK